jgi:hypothetical protein
VATPAFAEGTFVWTNFPFGPPDRPDRPGPVRHVAYVLGRRGVGASTQFLLAYTSSGPWRGAGAVLPIGVVQFDARAAAALNQRPFHIDLRCLARVPATTPWFPDLGSPGRGVIAMAGDPVRERVMKAAELLAARYPRLIEVRGV